MREYNLCCYDCAGTFIAQVISQMWQHRVPWTRCHFWYLSFVLSFFFLSLTDLNKCHSEPCENGACCVGNHEDYACICLGGWEGKNCESVYTPGLFLVVFVFIFIFFVIVGGICVAFVVLFKLTSSCMVCYFAPGWESRQLEMVFYNASL